MDSVSAHQMEPANGSLEIVLNRTQHLSLLKCSTVVFALHLYQGNATASLFSFDGGSLLRQPLPQFASFPMESADSAISAVMIVEIIPSCVSSSCASSHQLLAANKLTASCYSSPDAIPAQIEASSILLPKSPLFFHISTTEYSLLKNDIVVFRIPFATIEKSRCVERTILEKGQATGILELTFNLPNKSISDWIRLRVTFQEDHCVWSLFSITPNIDAHRELRVGMGNTRWQAPWLQLESTKDSTVFLNEETGRFVTSIPKQKLVNVGSGLESEE